MCDYQGYDFGADYADSLCIDGQLFDADNCDSNGNLYEPLEFKLCPQCCEVAAMDAYCEDNLDSSCKWPRYTAWHLVMDIRRNRDLPSIPFWKFARHRIYVEFFERLPKRIMAGHLTKRFFWATRWRYLMRWFWTESWYG